MFHGFYNLASGMVTQNRNLNVISNNMVNISTPGYKTDSLTTTTFQQEMLYRTGNQERNGSAQIGATNMIRVPEQTITDFSQGNYVETGNTLDFAIDGAGFFKVSTANGMAYTRNGSFYVDDEGCLALKGIGKVQGTGGEIYLENDDIITDPTGGIYTSEGELIDNLDIVDFEDYSTLKKQQNGVYSTTAQEVTMDAPQVVSRALEQSNGEPVKLMEDMIATQRSLQSAAQLLKIYDQVMGKATTEIGRM